MTKPREPNKAPERKRADRESFSPTSRQVRLVMELTGLGHTTASDRVFNWQHGHIDCDALFRPKRDGGAYPPRNPLIDQVAEAAGLTREGAKDRIWRVRHGFMPEEFLMLTTKEIRERRKAEGMSPQKTGDWGALGLGPRRSIASIPGGTAWERRELGR